MSHQTNNSPHSSYSADAAMVWLRRDLRLSDQPALDYALRHHDTVYVVYIHEPNPPERDVEQWPMGGASLWWLQQSLSCLGADFTAHDGVLNILEGSPINIIKRAIAQHQLGAVYWSRLYEPATMAQDSAVKAYLQQAGVVGRSFAGYLFVEPWHVETKTGGPYQVYTPFSKAVMPMLSTLSAPIPAPKNQLHKCQALSPECGTLYQVPDMANFPWLDKKPTHQPWYEKLAAYWQPGEQAAHAQLDYFLEAKIAGYAKSRDIPSRSGTSYLSPHLHFGEISPRQIWHTVQHLPAGKNDQHAEKFIKELLWREFSQHVLYHFPHTTYAPKQEKFAAMPWSQDAATLTRWQQGQTGIPIVDAGMRELWETGYMHNRVRMIVASLLTKNLNQHWRAGAEWFWDTLVDANLANNTQGWQWTAGCGVDAAPYFRIFNPVTQAERFDPQAEYIGHYVPELSALPLKYRFAPWQAPSIVLDEAEVKLGEDYPYPIVDLKASRAEALTRFKLLD